MTLPLEQYKLLQAILTDYTEHHQHKTIEGIAKLMGRQVSLKLKTNVSALVNKGELSCIQNSTYLYAPSRRLLCELIQRLTQEVVELEERY